MDDKGKEFVKQLQAEIAQAEADKQALIKEFEKVASEELDPETVKEKIRKEILPAAWLSLKDLILNAESEAVRANLLKWAFEYSSKLEQPHAEDTDKELATLLKAIAK